MYNKLFPPKDNKVVVEFCFTGEFEVEGLNNFNEVILEVGDEVYSTVDDPTRLYIEDTNKLLLNIGDVTNLEGGAYFPTITGFNPIYDDGFLLTSECDNELGHPIIVCR